VDLGADVPDGKPTELLYLPESRCAAHARRARRHDLSGARHQPEPGDAVGDQIVEAIETHTSLRGVAARRKAIDWLRRVGIPEPERRIDDYPFRMSGGQKQRVMIAMTLAAEPRLT
jgi:peptide/nickel transport system ATP-binding protein